ARTAAASLARAERTVVPSRSARASAVAAPRPPTHCSMAVLPVAGVLVRLDIESFLSVLRDGRAAVASARTRACAARGARNGLRHARAERSADAPSAAGAGEDAHDARASGARKDGHRSVTGTETHQHIRVEDTLGR